MNDLEQHHAQALGSDEAYGPDANAIKLARELIEAGRAYLDAAGQVESEESDTTGPVVEHPAMDLVREAIVAWPQFDSDEEVNGGDLVEWFGEWRARAIAIGDTTGPVVRIPKGEAAIVTETDENGVRLALFLPDQTDDDEVSDLTAYLTACFIKVEDEAFVTELLDGLNATMGRAKQ